jgi:para-nitrobenzyl esterase
MKPVNVVTTAGVVRGFWRAGSAAFLGIPFAEPPIGDLRFAPPVAHRPWDGVFDATRYGATPQRGMSPGFTMIPEPSFPGESTLTVNVFTPQPGPVAADALLPVLVYIHGGGYTAGSPSSPWYDGEAFNRDGVVTASVSYRLGFDGFGWISDVAPNRAALDWLLALAWVQDNIAAFGGDPSRVTIAGQSAGGGAVLTLVTMPAAQGLFARAIAISPVATVLTRERAEAVGRRLAALGGVDPTRAALSTLSEARVFELQERAAQEAAASRTGADSGVGAASETDAASPDGDPLAAVAAMLGNHLPLGPHVDGALITLPTADAVRAGNGHTIPLLLGTTDHEFTLALDDARELLASMPGADALVRVGLPRAAAEDYAAAHPELDTARLVGQYVTDVTFRQPAVEIADARAATTDPSVGTWLYGFGWRSAVFGEAVHCLDLPFFFDALHRDGVEAITGPRPPQGLADDIHRAAVSFIRGGGPGWPAWDRDTRVVRRYDSPSSVVADGYRDIRLLQIG